MSTTSGMKHSAYSERWGLAPARARWEPSDEGGRSALPDGAAAEPPEQEPQEGGAPRGNGVGGREKKGWVRSASTPR